MPFIIKPTITETFLERVGQTPDVVGYQYKDAQGAWKTTTYREFFEQCALVSAGLRSLGASYKQNVVLLSNTRYEWSLCDMAILGARAVTIPIYASNTPDDVAYIINHCEAKLAIVEDAKQLEKLLEKREALPGLERIVVIDQRALAQAAGRNDILSLNALMELGKRESARDPKRFEENLRAASPDDLITICYTSGTTGVPKGAMVTHDNMMSVLEDIVKLLGGYIHSEKEVILSFLPFSHILGKLESMAGYAIGWREAFAENIDRLVDNMGEVRPTLLIAVPRIFERAYGRIQDNVKRSGGAKQKMYEWALNVARKRFRIRTEKGHAGVTLGTKYALADQLVFSKIRDRFGGRLKFAICGGAPFARELGEYFELIGVSVLEGYGLTETCGPITVNTPAAHRFGTVGKPLPEVAIKIAEDGEILVKSRKVFRGYLKAPEDSAEALDGGWFHTGDIGQMDAEGFLQITDRKKDLIVTSGGKNIAPQKIENLAKTYPFISQFVVHGDRRNYLTALVTLDEAQLTKYANEQQILFSGFPELIKQPKIQGLVQRLVDDLNSKLASYETIKKFIILPKDFTIESGELTPSLKVKRRLISKRYQAELDSMYSPAP